MFVCSDTDYCETRQAEGHRGALLGEGLGLSEDASAEKEASR
jgi:alpha-D-ribose 1-methylphosphonate 5-phosphate C-P lyase